MSHRLQHWAVASRKRRKTKKDDVVYVRDRNPAGYLPTFGPAFIHLYGSTRDYSLIDEHSSLNAGLGEGVSYRARLLVAVRTEITDAVDIAPSDVDVEPAYPINEVRSVACFAVRKACSRNILDFKFGQRVQSINRLKTRNKIHSK